MAVLQIMLGLILISYSSPMQEPMALKKGVAFLHQGNFLITTSRWILVIDISFDSLQQQLSSLERHVYFLEQIIEVPNQQDDEAIYPLQSITPREVRYLRERVREFKRTLSSQRAMVMLPRAKRALDFVGKAMKYLFGVSTSDEYVMLSNKLAILDTKQKRLLHIVEAQTSILNHTFEVVKENTEQIQNLLISRGKIEHTLEAYRRAFYTGAALRYVENAFADFRSQLSDIREALDILGHGQLSPLFVSRQVLLDTLISIQNRLPQEITLIETPRSENLFKFYKWITVTSAAMPNKLRIFAEIPLITLDGYFNLYEIIRFPAYFPQANTFAFYQTEYPFIALSKSRQSYILLKLHDLHKCKSGNISLYSPEVPILKPPYQTCEYALFLGQDAIVKQMCEKRISNQHSPIFRRVDNRGNWIYSTPKPLSLVIECPYYQNFSQASSKVIKIINTGFLTLPMVCTGHTPEILLTSHFQHQSTFSLTIDKQLVIPPILDILNITEQDMLRSYQNLSNGLKEKSQIPKRSLSLDLTSRSFEDIQQQLKELEQMPSLTYGIENNDIWTSATHSYSIGGSVGGIILICCFVILCYWMKRRKNSSNNTSAPIIPITVSNTDATHPGRELPELPLKEQKMSLDQGSMTQDLPTSSIRPKSSVKFQAPIM